MVRRKNYKGPELQSFLKRPVSAAVQAAIYSMVLATSVQAAPTGGQVVGGSGSINQSGATTTINQASQNMAINWQSYNVNSNETVNYKQPNASSISLNRILSNDGSTIAGHINANGQVILVNPNGILFTPTAVINVGGIIASGMDISPDNFMNGKYIFNEVNGKKGTVVNTGTINASLGGNVALVGKKVENDGLIAAKLGTVTLAAGKQAVLTFDNGGVLGVRVSKAVLQKDIGVDPAVLNKGNIKASGGKVLLTASTSQDVFSQAVNSGNIQQATSVVVNADGSFTLGEGADTVNTGSIDASANGTSQNGGQIVMLGNNVTSSGSLNADAADGNGGNIELHSTDTTLLTQNSLTSAQSDNDGVGGIIKVLGDKVGLFDQSTVNVSGADGGGQALIGGDEHGANAGIQNASITYVGNDVNLFSDALDNGNGGKIINWSDGSTLFYGNVFAKGGKYGGDGGFVEVSGHNNLDFHGQVNTEAQSGNSGMLLLDPTDITIIAGVGDTNPDGDTSTAEFHGCPIITGVGNCAGGPTLGFIGADYDGPSTLYQSELEGLSATTDIVLQANRNIKINSLSNGVLDLQTTNGHSVQFFADANTNGIGDFSMDTGDTIRTQGGSVIIQGASVTAGDINTTGGTDTDGGDIKISTTNGGIRVGNLTTNGGLASAGNTGTNGGYVQLQTDDASTNTINITGNISTKGGDGTSGGDAGYVLVQSGASSGSDKIQLGGDISAQGGSGASASTAGSSNTIEIDSPLFTTTGDRTFSTLLSGASGTGNITIQNKGITDLSPFLSYTDIGGSLTINSGPGSNTTFYTLLDYNNVAAGSSLNLNAGNDITLFSVNDSDLSTPDKLDIYLHSDTDNNGLGDITTGYFQNTSYVINTGGGLYTVVGENYDGSSKNSSNSITVDTGAGDANINVEGSALLGAMNVGGALNVKAAGANGSGDAISQGSTNPSADILTSSGDATFTSTGTGSITLSNANKLSGKTSFITANQDNATFNNNVTTTLIGTTAVGSTNVGGLLSLQVSGDLDLQDILTAGSVNFTVNKNLTISNTLNLTSTSASSALNFGQNNNNGNIFNLASSGSITSSSTSAPVVAGGGGDDEFDMDALFTGTVDGKGGTDILRGTATPNTWTVSTATGGGDLNTSLTFANMETLTGGTGLDVDTFNVDAGASIGTLKGGEGGNQFNIYGTVNTVYGNGVDNAIANNTITVYSAGVVANINSGSGDDAITVNDGGSVTGDISAGAGNDTVTLAGTVNGLIDAGGDSGDKLVITASSDKVTDVAGNSVLNNGQDYTVKNFATIDATGTTSNTNGNTLIVDGGHTWNVSASNEGDVAGVHFLGFANLTGGTGKDNFVFGAAGAVTGTVDGGDTNTDSNTLTARTGVTNTWVFSKQDSGSVATGGAIYTKFAEIQNFVGAGTDTANLSSLSGITVDPTSYLGFSDLIGNNTETLTGHAGLNSTWLINGPNSGVLTLGNYPQWTFSGFATLSGSDASSSTAVTNQFSITTGGSFAGTINGGGNSGANASTNILSALGDSGATNVWQINASNSTLVQTASGATAVTTTFNGMQNINDGTQTPGADNNTLTVNGGATLNNVVFGNGSNNITVGLSNDTMSSAINSIITGTGANTITVNALGQVTSSGQSITSGDASTTAVSNITVHGAVGGSIATAGSGANVVTVSGTVGGVISGGGANSTLNITATGDQSVQLGSTPSGANYTGNNFGAVNANNSATGNTLVSDNSATNTWTVTGTKNDVNNGTIDTVFTNFTNLQGGAGYNDFTINAGINSVTANGNSGNSITVGAGSVSGTITAQGTGTNLITVTGNVAGLITGGGANTTLDVTNSGKNVQIGTTSIAGAPTTNYEITNIGQLTANAGNALIWGSAGGSNWTVSATGNAGKVGNTNFTGFSNLWGGTGNNTFNINGNIGNITATGKVDKVNINAGTTGSIALSGSTNTINVSGVVNGKASATGAGSNTINIDGSVNGLVSAIGTGGGASNTVNVNQGGFVNDNQMTNNAINVTGNGTNVVNLAGTVTGIINGNSQNTANNTINITAKDKIVQLGTSIVSGEAPDYMVNDFGNINAINDSASTYQNGNVLIGYTNNAANWTIDNINKGYLTGGGVTTSFTNFGNLVGGAKGDTFTLNNDGNTTHGELTGWQDGSKSSVTTFTINSKSLFTYDLLGAPSTYPSPIYNDPTTDTVSVYGFNKTGGKNTIGLSLNNNNVWVIHVDAANSNTTDADLYINGSSTISTTFSGSFIKGGAQDDTFIWKSGALAGGIYGGSSGTNSLIIPSTNTGPKTILLGAAGSAVTTGTSSVMPVLNLQYMVANNTATNTIVGSNLSSIGWSIQSVSLAGIVTNNTSLGGTLPTNTSINSGIVDDGTTSTTFTGFGIVQGGAQGGNTYTLASGGGLSGYINGNGAGDNLVLGSSLNATPMTVKLLNSASGSSPNTSTIAVYNVGKVTGTDTTGASNDTLVAMSGSNFTDNWAINDVNGGTVDNGTGIGTQSVNFVGFGNLVGNAGNDQFDVSGAGSMSGVIHANGGTDSLNVALTGSENGQVKFLADKGAIASVAVTGTAGDGVFTPSVAGSAYDQIQYTTGGNSYDVNYTKANNITDSVAANSLTVNGASTSSSISLSSPSGGQADAFDFSVNGHTSVSETGKSQLNVTGLSGNDTIALTTGLDLTGMGVDLSAQNISQTTGVLAADSLNLDGVGTAGSANNPFNIAVANLNTSNHGAVYLNQQGDLTLFGMNSSGLLDITSDGNISSSAPLVSTGNLDIASTNGDINLSGSNQLGGMITLSGGNIAINNTTDLQLGNITATGNSLNISTTGASNISQATGTAINNQNATGKAVMTLDAQQGGNITLANAGNQINILHVKDGGAVKFNAKSSIGLDIVNANSVDLTTTDGIFDAENGAVTNISANSVMLSAVNGIGGGTVDYNNSNGKFTIDPRNPVYLSTSNLSVLNNNANPNSYKAPIVLQNNGNVTITDLRNNGNIYLYNKGDISLAVAPKVTNTPNRGAIDANYGGSYDKSSGAYTNTVYYGNVALIGTGSKSITTQGVGVSEADITAQNLYVQSFSKFGLKTAPIRLDIHNQFSLLTTDTGAVAYPFGRPANVTTSADLVTYSGVNILSGEQLINIQSLGDVDPAIFTAVRNYDHEDVAILLPPDQRLGDDQECNNKDKKCKKRHQAMN